MAFYKLENNILLEAQNFVSAPNYELLAKNKNQYNLPVDGWYWFDTPEQAKKFFGIVENNY